jgi:hypothetical protein
MATKQMQCASEPGFPMRTFHMEDGDGTCAECGFMQTSFAAGLQEMANLATWANASDREKLANHARNAAGWNVFAVDFPGHAEAEIQRIDAPEDGSAPIFDSDDAAIAHVVALAAQGSWLHLDALRHANQDPPVIAECLKAGIFV